VAAVQHEHEYENAVEERESQERIEMEEVHAREVGVGSPQEIEWASFERSRQWSEFGATWLWHTEYATNAANW
jgi:hypothetical protein